MKLIQTMNFMDVTRRKRNHRKIGIIGDSLLTSIESHKMNKCLKSTKRVYVKYFTGSTIADIYDYAKPSQRHGNDIYILYTGSNDLRLKKTTDVIAEEIIKLGLELKTEENKVIISSIVGRKDDFNEKGWKVNHLLKSKCTENDLGYIENTNIKVHKHLNGAH